jgi:hypothetical protein
MQRQNLHQILESLSTTVKQHLPSHKYDTLWQWILQFIELLFFVDFEDTQTDFFYTGWQHKYKRRSRTNQTQSDEKLRTSINETNDKLSRAWHELKSLCFFLTDHHAIKAYWRSGVIGPWILWPRN